MRHQSCLTFFTSCTVYPAQKHVQCSALFSCLCSLVQATTFYGCGSPGNSPTLYIASLCAVYGHMCDLENLPQRAWDSSCLSANKCLSHSDPFSQSLLLSANSPQSLSSDNSAFSDIPPCALIPDHEELVTMESEEQEVSGGMEHDPLSDSGYIELHYYETHQYLVLPGDTQLDLETVEILQLDAEAQEAAGSLLDLAGGGYWLLRSKNHNWRSSFFITQKH